MIAKLGVDLGELEDEPEALYALCHVAHIACGGHAGDARTMLRAIERCERSKTALSAHPSYPDRANFGRVVMALPESLLFVTLRLQCLSLRALAEDRGLEITYVKAHGALYHQCDRDEATASAFVRAAVDSLGAAVTVVGPTGSTLSRVCEEHGVALASEGFADRAMREDGALVPRGEPGAVLTDVDAVAAQAARLRDRFAFLCVHGDSANAEPLARAVRAVLDGE